MFKTCIYGDGNIKAKLQIKFQENENKGKNIYS